MMEIFASIIIIIIEAIIFIAFAMIFIILLPFLIIGILGYATHSYFIEKKSFAEISRDLFDDDPK